ncbi:MAG: hypothetical protein PVF68_17650 [Acidobacteriota bacterium]|jgi:hypothetical protein
MNGIRQNVAVTAAVVAIGLGGAAPAADAPEPGGQEPAAMEQRLEALEALVRRLQEEIDRLREESDSGDVSRIADLEAQIEVLTQELERRRLGRAAYRPAEGSAWGLGPAASKVYGIERGVSIGGYGEMLYENFPSGRDDGSAADRKDQIDFLRAVFYFGYKFNDRILFNSEIEFEHGSTEGNGAVSVEFAYLDFLFRDAINVRAGMLLTPVGFINELHEPPIFLGARRPDVETRIIPTTWRENGAGIFGDAGPVSYRVYLQAGLDAAGFTADEGIREGRQGGSKALAEDWAVTGRIDWTILPGLLVGGSGQVGDSGQGAVVDGETLQARVTLVDLHAEWRWRGLQLRGLWTQMKIGDAAAINQLNGFTGADSVGSRLEGWYLQAGYDVLAPLTTDQKVIPYVRWEEYDTQKEVPSGYAANPANDVRLLTYGVAYQPIPQVILKVDWQDYDNAANTGLDRLNVALGYLF